LPVHGLICNTTLSIFITGFIGVGDPLFLALGITQVSTGSSLDIVLIDTQFFELVYGLVVHVVHVVTVGMLEFSCIKKGKQALLDNTILSAQGFTVLRPRISQSYMPPRYHLILWAG
jgi:hypothetical protein